MIFSPLIFAGELYEHFPKKIDDNGKYVFYSHGLIVEGDNPTPINARWGKYEFPKIKAALSSDSYNLIAYHRPKKTNPNTFALKLADDVKLLIKAGVKAENITLLGFSRGGYITILASSYLKLDKVNIALLASCFNFMKNKTGAEVYGNIYSIYETSDRVGSCQFLIEQSGNVDSFEEISISTGKEHGAFFRPMPEWIAPLKVWLKQDRS